MAISFVIFFCLDKGLQPLNLLFRLLCFVILYSLQCKIEGHAVEKTVLIWKDQREFLCAKIYRNSIINENALNFECSLIHHKGRPSNYLFQLFLTL